MRHAPRIEPTRSAGAPGKAPSPAPFAPVGARPAWSNHEMLRMLSHPGEASAALQRKCARGGSDSGECAECKQKREGMLQRATAQRGAASSVPPIVHDILRSPGQPLDRATRAYFEPRFGQDLGNVRVHTDGKAAASARAVNALAYTVGRDLVFGASQYAPENSGGKKLLAHELAHVVQQSNTIQSSRSSLTIGAAGSPLEQEADRIAQAVQRDDRGRLGVGRALPLLQREVTTDNCEALESDVKSAHDKAMDMTGKALTLLKSYDGTNPKSVSDALSQHFHTTDLSDAENIIYWIELAKSGAEDAQYECHEDEEHDSAVAWSMWCVPFTDILLYKPWFDTSRTQTKKAKTMIHEWMHRYSCMYDLGYEGSEEYKNSSTFRAINNAAPYAAVIEALGS